MLLHTQSLPRQIRFEGAHNFRDLGGYPLSCGGSFIPGQIYRSDHLGRLTGADRAKLSELGVATVVDWRRASERAENPDLLMGTGINEVWLPVEAEGADVINIRHEVEAGRVDAQAAREFLIEANRLFVTRFAEVYSKFLHLLLKPLSLPLVFHCSAGKDRAGYAAALTLLVAGASKHDVMTDYLATNRCNEKYRRALTAAIPEDDGAEAKRLALDVLMQVEERYLAAAFSEIDAGYRDASDYMSRALAFDADKQASLKALLTDAST